MKKILVAAISEDNALGKSGELLWNMPSDEAFLLNTIRDGFLLSGRTSFESAQGSRIFDHRKDVLIVTGRKDYQPEKGMVAHGIQDAFQQAQHARAQRLYILGGASIYKQTIKDADELIITRIHEHFPEADVFFPEIKPEEWVLFSSTSHPADEKNPYPYSFLHFKSKSQR